MIWHRSVKYGNPNTYLGTSEEFVQNFRKFYAAEPLAMEALGASSGLLLQIGIELAGSLDKNAIRDVLLNQDESTFWGSMKLDPTGHNELQPTLLMQIQDAKITQVNMNTIIYPAQWPWVERKCKAGEQSDANGICVPCSKGTYNIEVFAGHSCIILQFE